MTDLHTWAIRHHVSLAALDELRAMLTATTQPERDLPEGTLEADVQAAVRVLASQRGDVLFRNNIGVLQDAQGRYVRYGLANDSKRMNEQVKSGDLVGIRRVLITSEMVGRYIGQFYSVECKRKGWRYAGTAREQAQLRWVETVVAMGGVAEFSTGGLSA